MINDCLNSLQIYARFCLGLIKFLSKKNDFEKAWLVAKERMAHREENFLKIIKKGIFEYKKSPYLELLKLANYQYKDIEMLVFNYGLEETLRILKEDGVYFTIEEFKGIKPTFRKGKKFTFKEKDFDNPYTVTCYEKYSGGTRGAGGRIRTNWDYLSDKSIYRGIIVDIFNLSGLPHIMIQNVLPYGPGIIEMLHLSKFKIYPIKLVSLVNERSIRISLKFRIALFYILYMSRILGIKFPNYEFTDLKDISKIVDLIEKINEEYKGCCIITYVSSALRICLAAKEKGVNFSGVIFNIAGEPLTNRINKEIESTGAKSIPYYAFTEAGVIGAKCNNASTDDDVHLFKDHLALISYKRKVMDDYVNSFLFTTLLSSAPKILLNVESGDHGIIETRECGCPFDKLGFYEHIHHIRSFEKLTAESMTFYGTNLIMLIQETLPSKFGGTSLDYQLIEEEGEKGIRCLIVMISPEIVAEEKEIINTILNELKKGDDSQKIMTETWFRAGTIKIRRDYPVLTKAGKLYPLHILSKR